MAHPHAACRADETAKAHSLIHRTGNRPMQHRARGGKIHEDAAEDAQMIERGVHEHESHLHKGEPKTKMKLAHGGHVDGEKARHHLAKRARGGAMHHHKKGGSTKVNVIVAPQGGGGARPVPVPVPARPPMGGAPAPMPPPGAGPMGAPMGVGPMAPRPGMPPGMPMRARGGKVAKRADGGDAEARTNANKQWLRLNAAALDRGAGRTPKYDLTGGPEGAPAPAPFDKDKGLYSRARGGKVPHMDAGAMSGPGRIEKTHEYGSGGFKPKKRMIHKG